MTPSSCPRLAWVLAAAATFSAPPLAPADRLVLHDGQSFEGRLVRESPDAVSLEIVVQGQVVEMSVPRDRIARHDRGESLLDRHAARAAETPAGDAAAQAALAEWCRDRKLGAFAARHALEAVRVDPGQKTAGEVLRSLGYVRSGDRWVTEAEDQRAKGLELWKGTWRPREEVLRLQAGDLAEQRKASLAATRAEWARLAKEAEALRGRLQEQQAKTAGLEEQVRARQEARDEARHRFLDARQRLAEAQSSEKEAEELAFVFARGILAWSELVDPATREKKAALKAALALARGVVETQTELDKAERLAAVERTRLASLARDLSKLEAEERRLGEKEKALGGMSPEADAQGADPAADDPSR